MDVVVICNGLGNQMSQYAFFLQKKSISKSTRFIFDKNSLSQHNGYELDKVFNIKYNETLVDKALHFIFRILGIKKLPIISKPLIKLLNIAGVSICNENYNYDFDERLLLPAKGLRFYYGGWHSERYFCSIRDEVLRAFRFKIDKHDKNTLRLLDEIHGCNSVSIHIRRGDYLSDENMKTFGAVCSKEYFESAIDKICSLVDNPHFFVFSNDVSWVQNNLKRGDLTIVDSNKGVDSWKDMFLISNCKHNINSNSSFSWWGAWFNGNSAKIVIVPRFFINNLKTKDIYPSGWLQLTDY